MMEGIPETAIQLARSLRPTSMWYAAVTAFAGLVVWCYQGTSWAEWPLPFKMIIWGWMGITVLAGVYIPVAALSVAKSIARFRAADDEGGEDAPILLDAPARDDDDDDDA